MTHPRHRKKAGLVAWAAAAAIGLAVTATSAEAATFNLGTLAPNESPAIGNSVAKGAFIDLYTFMLSTPSDGAATLVSITLGTARKITGLSYSLRSGSTTIAGPVGENVDLMFTGLLTATEYTLRVTGTATGTQGGTYAGGLVTAALVPIPAALPLAATALVGLGGIGWLKRRQKTDAAAVPA